MSEPARRNSVGRRLSEVWESPRGSPDAPDLGSEIAPSSPEKGDRDTRWVVLLLISWALVGDFYCYDNPAAMKDQLRGHFSESMDRSSFETSFALLYSVYSFPNVILPFFGGLLVDRLGTQSTLIGFNVMLTLASAIVALGVSWKSFNVLVAGRILYGFAGESLTVVQSAILTQWFKGKELAFTFGISLAFSRGGSVLNNYFSPYFAQKLSLTSSFFMGTVILASCVVTSVLYAIIDRSTEASINETVQNSLLRDENKPERSDHIGLDDPKTTDDTTSAWEQVLKEVASIQHFSRMFWIVAMSAMLNYAVVMPWNNTAQELLLQRDLFTAALPLSTCCCWEPGQCYQSWPNATGGRHYPSVTDAKACRSQCEFSEYRAVALNLTSDQEEHLDCGQPGPLYGLERYNKPEIPASAPYLKRYCDKIKASEQTAGIWMSIPYYINVASSPFLGWMVDRFGQCATICALAPAVFSVVHICLGLTNMGPIPLLVGQGVAYSCFAAAVWPPVVYIVEEKYIGAAYGTMTALMNTGFAVFPIVVAYIYQLNGNSYLPAVELFYAGLAGLGAIVGVWLWFEDARIGSPYNRVHTTDGDTTVLTSEADHDP